MLPTLHTDRLSLEALRPEDAKDVYLMDRNPKVMRFIGKEGRPKNRREVEAWIKRRLPKGDGLGTWSAFLKKDRTFVGCFLLIQLEDSPYIEIGYRLMEQSWGKGFATEGASRILTYAFEALGLKEVVAISYPENTSSQKVMEKLGMRYVKKAFYHEVEVVFYRMGAQEYYSE